MIIKCDKCGTRFRMADEKMQPGGTKVRCAKCKQVFLALPPQEPVPAVAQEKSPETAPADVAESVPVPERPSSRSEENLERDSSPSGDSDGEEFGFEDFTFGDSDSESSAALEDDEDFGLGDFDFSREEVAASTTEAEPIQEKPVPSMPDEPASSTEDEDTEDWRDFSLQDEEAEETLNTTSDEAKSEKPSVEESGEEPLEFTFAEDKDQSGIEDEEDFDFSPEDLTSDIALEDDDEPEDEEAVHTDSLKREEEPFAFAAAVESAPEGDSPRHDASLPDRDLGKADREVVETPTTSTPSEPPFVPPPKSPARKSPVATLMVFILVVLIILTAVTGYLFWQKGPQAFEQLLLGLTGEQTRPTSSQERIELTSLEGKFINNQNAGELFVIHGQAINRFAEPRSAIQVKGVVYGGDGKPTLQQTVFCGNPLTEEQLRNLPYGRIEEAMNNQFGAALSNLNVRPGTAIPFTIVFRNLPAGMSEFTVEMVDSRPPTARQ